MIDREDGRELLTAVQVNVNLAAASHGVDTLLVKIWIMRQMGRMRFVKRTLVDVWTRGRFELSRQFLPRL